MRKKYVNLTMNSIAGYEVDIELSLWKELYGADADGNRGMIVIDYDIEDFTIKNYDRNEYEDLYDEMFDEIIEFVNHYDLSELYNKED